MAGGKVFGVGGLIHTVAYGDDVVRVCVETVYDAEAIVPLPTSEIQYVRDAMNSFIGWPIHLVKPLSYVSNIIIPLPNCHLNKYLNLIFVKLLIKFNTYFLVPLRILTLMCGSQLNIVVMQSLQVNPIHWES